MRLRKTEKLKWLATALILVCLVQLDWIYYIAANPGFGGRDLYLDDLPSTASYVVDTDGTYVWATRYDGKIAYSGTDAVSVIQNAIDALTSGRTWKEKVVLKGSFTLDATITVRSYTILDIQGCLRNADNTVMSVITIDGNFTDILNGEIDGNKDNNTPDEVAGIEIVSYSTNILIYHCYIHDCAYYGIQIKQNADNITLSLLHLQDNGSVSDGWGAGIYIQFADNVKIYNIHMIGTGNSDTDVCGIINEGGDYLQIMGGTIDRCDTAGLYLDHGPGGISMEDSSLSHFTVVNCYTGIYIGHVERTIIEAVTIKNNTNGVKGTHEPDEVYIRQSYFYDNTNDVDLQAEGNIHFKDNFGFITEKSGCKTNCLNGTYVAHGLAGTPDVVTLTIDGTAYINSTCFLMSPTVIASNSTHFQVGFYYYWNATAIYPVTTFEQRDVYWYAEYVP